LRGLLPVLKRCDLIEQLNPSFFAEEANWQRKRTFPAMHRAVAGKKIEFRA
jgi:hypothetical protein